MAEQSGVQSVERAFDLIELMCKNGEMSVTALSAGTGLHKTTVCRLLGTLTMLGYVRQSSRTGHYGLTLKFLKISSGLLGSYDIRRRARPMFERLSRSCGETVHLVSRDGANIVYIDKFESQKSSVRMVSQIGLSLPMVCTAVGKAILATLPDSEVRAVWDASPHVKKTGFTITEYDSFVKELDTVRLKGYAVDNEENELGVRCVAAAIADIDGQYTHAFSVSAPKDRMDDETLEKYSDLVLRTRDEIENSSL